MSNGVKEEEIFSHAYACSNVLGVRGIFMIKYFPRYLQFKKFKFSI